MGRKNKGKRKKSDNSLNNDSVCKAGKFTGVEESDGEEFSVSNILNWTNSILYGENVDTCETGANVLISNFIDYENLDKNPQNCSTSTPYSSRMDQSIINQSKSKQSSKTDQRLKEESTNDDITRYLKDIAQTLQKVEEKVVKLDILESRVENFEKECNKIWNYIYDHSKQIDNRLDSVEERSNNVEFVLGDLSSKIQNLEIEKCALKNELVYLKSQSMRNNLLFVNIPEGPKGEEEDCERVLRTFLHEKLKMAEDTVKQLQFDRVHRIGQRQNDSIRRMVVKFTLFKDKELVRKEKRILDGTDFHLHEQFPREVAEKRRRMWPKLKEAIDQNKRAWMSYDTLYIEGIPVKDVCE